MKAIAPLFALLIVAIYARDVDYCFVYEDEPYVYMGTKTPYDFAHNVRRRFQVVPNCQPEQMWMMAVHGISYPNENEIRKLQTLTDLRNQIIYNHETRRNGRMCNEDLDNLRNWRLNDATHLAETLTAEGAENVRLLARRLQSNFREILQPAFNEITESNFKFRANNAENSRATMEVFMESMLGSKRAVRPEDVPANDTLLTAYKTCQAWDSSNNQTNGNDQLAEFDKNPLFQNLVLRVSRRLGYLYNVSTNSILTMYDMCRYEKAWHIAKLSPWCAVFSKDELRVLEYREDLHYYYLAGYGQEINTLLGCPLIQDMMMNFGKLDRATSSEGPRGIFYFADAITMLNLLTTLEIAKDDTQLTSSNYYGMTNRQWRTSLIAPYMSNLVAVFYKCSDSGRPYRVMFYLNEEPLMVKGCEVGLCDWEFLKQKLNAFATECKVNKLCWNTGGASSSAAWSSIILLLFTLISLNLCKR